MWSARSAMCGWAELWAARGQESGASKLMATQAVPAEFNLRDRQRRVSQRPGRLPAMDIQVFWRALDAAKDSDKPLDEAVVDYLLTLPADEILAFEHRFSLLRAAVYRWDVWAAAYLIGRGCSDDRFSDFTAGLVALGREWYEQAAACPDALAEHPAVRIAAGSGDQGAIFAEGFNFAASTAYEQLTGDSDAFWEDLAAYSDARVTIESEASEGMGESFDFGDDAQMHRRLPRLAALHLRPEPS